MEKTILNLNGPREKNVLVLHGPNLNMLGAREPELYGSKSLDAINTSLYRMGHSVDVGVACFQSNHEGVLIDRIQSAYWERVDYIVFNPAGYTHTSVSLRDALLAVKIPFVETHITDPETREGFRATNYFRDIAAHVVSGEGPKSYELALGWVLDQLDSDNET